MYEASFVDRSTTPAPMGPFTRQSMRCTLHTSVHMASRAPFEIPAAHISRLLVPCSNFDSCTDKSITSPLMRDSLRHGRQEGSRFKEAFQPTSMDPRGCELCVRTSGGTTSSLGRVLVGSSFARTTGVSSPRERGGRPLGLGWGWGWKKFVFYRRKGYSNGNLGIVSSTCFFGYVPCAAMSSRHEPSWMGRCTSHGPNQASRSHPRIQESSWTHARVQMLVSRHPSIASTSKRRVWCYVRMVAVPRLHRPRNRLVHFACPGSCPNRTRIVSQSNPKPTGRAEAARTDSERERSREREGERRRRIVDRFVAHVNGPSNRTTGVRWVVCLSGSCFAR